MAYKKQEAFVDDQLVKAYFEKDTNFGDFMNALAKEKLLEYRTTRNIPMQDSERSLKQRCL